MPASPKQHTRYYVGGVDEIVVAFPTGRKVTVARGDKLEVTDEELAALGSEWSADAPAQRPEEGANQ